MEEFRINRKIRSLDFEMPSPHAHDFCELYYLVSGRCKMFVGHHLYYIEEGDVLLLAPGTLHRATYPDREKTERITINFPLKALSPLKQVCKESELQALFQKEWLFIPLPARPAMEALLQRMQEETESGDALSLFLAGNRLFEVFALLLRHQEERGGEHTGETEDLMLQAARYVCQNFEKSLSLQDLADMAHVTPAYFSRKFKQVTGFGFKEYLIYVRIAQAEKLLTATELPVTEVALACGFGDGNYFGDVFKKIKGISPRSYRQQSRLS